MILGEKYISSSENHIYLQKNRAKLPIFHRREAPGERLNR
jgi:hypothetical protein